MRKLLMSIAVLLIAIGLLGCGAFYSAFPAPTPTVIRMPIPTAILAQPGTTLPQLTGNWQITMTLTGGVAGRDQSVEISSSGEMIITDLRTKQETTSQLPADKIASLTKLVASSNYRPPSKPQSGCADCFVYNLEIVSGGEKFQAQLDDISLPDSGLQPLISFIGGLSN